MSSIIDQICKTKILPLYFNTDFETCKAKIKACYKAGLHAFEFTNRGAEAPEIFGQLKKDFATECPELKLGIGTIYTADQARQYIALNADFIIQPVCTQGVADVCKEANKPWIPAGMTMNELYNAQVMGAELVKVFPGNTLGPGYIKNVRGPLPHLKLMVTGGVDATVEDITTWLKAGVNVCGLGSQLFTVENSEITLRLKNILEKI
jgi:2-dehydro-3-deoxyphosphogluconate aldolase / (4S)-4-hydroxy-2-oxoglutarate aldolase